MSDVTYAYCIENLRYIHKIIGMDALIKEVLFIDHLSQTSKIESVKVESVKVESVKVESVKVESVKVEPVKVEPVMVEPVSEKPNIIESKLEIELDVDNEVINETVPENKNIVINSQKYIRTVLSDEYKCECIINNGKRCTLKKVNDSKYCSRHKVKMSKIL